MTDKLNEMTQEAVVKQLKLKDFFDDERDREKIYKRLEESDRLAMQTPSQQDLIFFAASFPVITSIIQMGASRKDFQAATQWADREFPNTDAVSMLSALTFLYVVDKGVQERSDDPEKVEIWGRIRARVDKLLGSK